MTTRREQAPRGDAAARTPDPEPRRGAGPNPGSLDPANAIGKDYFSENYHDYERQTSRRKLDFYMRLVRKWVPAGSRLFELGVGKGHFLERATGQYACLGCDIDRHGLETARGRVPTAALYRGSVECIPGSPCPDAVVAWDVLEHLERLDEALRVIHSRLSDEGVLIGIVPVYDGPLGWLVRALDRDRTHVSRFSRSRWVQRLEEHGFEIVERGGTIRRLVLSRWYVHLTWPQSLLRSAGSAMYFVAKKKESAPVAPRVARDAP